MDNTPFIVTPYPARPRSPWKLEIRARFAGKKIRRFFATEAGAYTEGERLTGQIQDKGVSSLPAAGMTVAGAIKRFWAIRGPAIKGKSHRAHMERNLDLFSESLGTRGIKAIGTTELSAFWNRAEWPDGKSTRWQAFVYLRLFFNWAERYDLIDRNPIRRVDPPARPGPLTGIVTAEEMKVLLGLPLDWQRAFVCLGGLAGLRTSEALRVDPKADLNWREKEIHVAGGGKTGERYVKMSAAFIRHCPREFAFPNQRNFYASLRKAIGKTSLGKLPQNALRHSWFTYHLAAHRSAAVTAHEGGNSESMVKKIYALPAKRANQAAYWRL